MITADAGSLAITEELPGAKPHHWKRTSPDADHEVAEQDPDRGGDVHREQHVNGVVVPLEGVPGRAKTPNSACARCVWSFRYHLLGKICVFHSSSLKVVPISPNASYCEVGTHVRACVPTTPHQAQAAAVSAGKMQESTEKRPTRRPRPPSPGRRRR